MIVAPKGKTKEDTSSLLDLIYHEIYLREIHQEPIDLEMFSKRFPYLRSDIALMFEVHQLVDTGNLEVSDELPTNSEIDEFPLLMSFVCYPKLILFPSYLEMCKRVLPGNQFIVFLMLVSI